MKNIVSIIKLYVLIACISAIYSNNSSYSYENLGFGPLQFQNSPNPHAVISSFYFANEQPEETDDTEIAKPTSFEYTNLNQSLINIFVSCLLTHFFFPYYITFFSDNSPPSC